MSNSSGLKSNVSNINTNNSTQPEACPNVPKRMPGMSITFETGKPQKKRSEDVNIAVKQNRFDAWKAGAKNFSWDLFAIPQDLIDSLRGGVPNRTAPHAFHKYASGVVKENGWKYIHAMTLWSQLPEDFKREWRAAAEHCRAQGTRKSTPSCAEVPNFKEVDHFHNEKCAYFIFQATPALPASPVVDNDKIDQPGGSGDAFPTSQHSTFDNPNGTILLKDEIILSKDDNSQPIPDLLGDLLNFDNSLMFLEHPIPPELNLQVSSLTYIPTFDFGLISDFGVDNLIPSRDSIPAPSPENLTAMLDGQRPAKRRRINPEESVGFRDYPPIQNPEPWAPSNELHNYLSPQFPPSPSSMPKVLMKQSDTGPGNLPTVVRDNKQKLCNHQGATSSAPPAEATESSASFLSYASTSAGTRGQESRDQYDIGASIFWEYIAPSNFTSVLGSGQSNGDNALDSGIISDIFPTLTHQQTTEYLSDSLLETQESSNYGFPGGFGF